MSKIFPLCCLSIGDKFEIPELLFMRNLEVVRVSESGTGIKGEWSEDRGETWKLLSLNYTISNGTMVRLRK
jgi:hypothetical protein